MTSHRECTSCSETWILLQANEHVLLTGQADGTLKLFAGASGTSGTVSCSSAQPRVSSKDWTNPHGPIMSLEEHTAEAATRATAIELVTDGALPSRVKATLRSTLSNTLDPSWRGVRR